MNPLEKAQANTCEKPLRATCLSLSAVFFFLTFGVSPVLAYNIYLKDGTIISAQEKYQVQGDYALVTLESGSLTRFRLEEIDIERTRKYNASLGLSGAIVIDQSGPGSGPGAPRSGAEQTLRDLIRSRQSRNFGAPDTAEPEAVRLRKTPAGYDDLQSLARRPLEDRERLAIITRVLRENGLSRFSVYRGTRTERILVEAVTENKGAVFDDLEGACKAFVLLAEELPGLDALELLMHTGARSRAGQFVLSRENAPLLANGRISVADFFVEHVEF